MQYIFSLFYRGLGVFGFVEIYYIYLIFYSIRRCKNFKEFKEIASSQLTGVMKKAWFILVAQLVVTVALVGMFDCVGNTQIGSFFEKRNYKENYYVLVSYSDNNDKYYKRKATITRNEVDDETFSCSYFLDQIHFKNHTSNFYDSELFLNEEVIVWDYSTDEDLHVILTNERCN